MPAVNLEFDALDDCAKHWLARWSVPGMAIAVLRGGAADGYGYGISSLRTRYPVTPDMLFRVASISKVFTATLVMTLADDGALDLDTPVVAYLPGLELSDPEARQAITPRHLLTHTSGLWGDFFIDKGLGEDALDRAIREFATLRQLTAPGELWAYCNSGFHLAGAVVQAVAGAPFETAMRERIFEPLGMEQTGFFAHEAIVWPLAVGHSQANPGGDEHRIAPQYYPRNRNPAGGVITSALDLLKFARMHLGDGEIDGRRLLSPASTRAMREPWARSGDWADEWGIGWDIRDVGGARIIGHGGSINGYQSRLTLVPERDFALAILTNSGRGSAAYRRVEAWLLDHYCDLRAPEPEIVALPKADLRALAGIYRQPSSEFRVQVEGDGLRVEQQGPHPITGERVPYPPFHLAPIGPRRFIVTDGESAGERVEFFLHDDGAPRFVRIHGRLADYAGGAPR